MLKVNSSIVKLAFGALGMSAVPAYAAPAWSQPFFIQSFISTDSGLTIVAASNTNPMSCTSSTWMSVNFSDPNFALVSSTILTAFTQNRPIKTWQNSCNSDGTAHFIAAWVDK